MVGIEGAAWQTAGALSLVGGNNLVAKVLCERHNSALGALDLEFGRFFRTLRLFDQDLGADAPDSGDDIGVFAGPDIERFMLKTVCGLVSAGAARGKLWPRIVDLLFGRTAWPEHGGLYASLAEGKVTTSERIGVRVLVSREDHTVLLARFNIRGINFDLALDGRICRPSHVRIHRPNAFVFAARGVVKVAELTWSHRADRVVFCERE